MKCELCTKTMLINYGNAYHTFCKRCSTSAIAQKILESGKELSVEEKTTKDSIDIPLRSSFIIITIAICGLTMLLVYQLLKYNEKLALPIIAATISIFLIIGIARNIYYRKLIGNRIIAQSVKNKLICNVILSIIILAIPTAGFLLFANKINDAYAYLLQEKYIHSVFQLFNWELMNSLKSHAYDNKHLKAYIIILDVQRDLISLLNMCVFLVFGIVQLQTSLQSDTISKIGILTRGHVFRWKEFTTYSWGKYYGEPPSKNSTGYYDLQLVRKNGKLVTYILGEKESPINLKIHAQDKDKVDQLIRSVITNGS